MSKINNKVKTVRMTEDDCKSIVERITMRILREHRQGNLQQNLEALYDELINNGYNND